MVEFALDQVWLLTLFVLMERETASQIGIATPFKQEAATLVRAEDFCQSYPYGRAKTRETYEGNSFKLLTCSLDTCRRIVTSCQIN